MTLHDRQHPALLLLLGLFLLLIVGVARAQGTLTLPSFSSDPLKIAERQTALRQTLAEQQATIEQLRQELARVNAEQPGQLYALEGETVAATTVERARLDHDALQLQQAHVQDDIDSAQRQIKALESAIAALAAQEDAPPETGSTEQRAQISRLLEQRRTDLELEQENLRNLKE